MKSRLFIGSIMVSATAVFGGTTITISNGETQAISSGNKYKIPSNASVTLTQVTSECIDAQILLNADATVTLKGINVRGYNYSAEYSATAAIYCQGNATIILADDTTNTLCGNYQSFAQNPCAYPAIKVGPSGTTLTVKGQSKGTGKLSATGSGGASSTYQFLYSAGIGTTCNGNNVSCGNIVIEGGDITVNADKSAKGIGTGAKCSQCGNITIKDTITKVEASIGAASDTYNNSCGTITIGPHLNQTKKNEIFTITPMTYAIAFDANGGSGDETRTLRYGVRLGTLPTPNRLGYTFTGWYTKASGGLQISESNTVTTAVTYYAHWTEIQYAVTFDSNGGNGDTSKTVNYGTMLGTLPEPVREGYVFIGWFTEREGGEIITAEIIVPNNITYYAHWIVSPYVFSGDADWTVQIDESWRSGAIGNDETSSMEMVLTNGCKISFSWKCSCEPLVKGQPYDYLSFQIDGVQQDFICGETDWQTKTYEVPGNGEHVFRWTYQKDEEGSAGEDCAWVKQVVVTPRMTLSFDGGEATDGAPPASMSFYADDESAVLPDCGTLSLAKHSFTGWSDGVNTYTTGTVVARSPIQKDGTPVSLTAVWAANTLSTPVIVAPETYEADSATVTITADEGATIYYTLDGSKPNPARPEAAPYQGPFEIEGSVVIRAIAVRDNYYDSEVASFTVTRPTWTFGEYLNCPERTFATGGDAEWVRAKGVSDDGYALRSGTIGNSQTSRLETVVYGAGTIAFRCKVDGEIVKKIVFDGLAFCIDGVQQGDLMGENVWTNQSFTVTGDGRHTLSWLYVKDEDGNGGGEDCAWLDNVVWTANDPLPPLDVTATDNDAKAILGGLSDVWLSEKIVGTAAYTAFRSWVDGKGLSHTLVRDAPNAWLSYALDAPELMTKIAPLSNEDVVIESIAPSSMVAGAFDLVVDIAGAEIGMGARLVETLGVEGSTDLNESAFSSDNVSFTLERTADGKAKVTVTRCIEDNVHYQEHDSFFMRVIVK